MNGRPHPYTMARLCQLAYKPKGYTNTYWANSIEEKADKFGGSNSVAWLAENCEAFATSVYGHRCIVIRGTELAYLLDAISDLRSIRRRINGPFEGIPNQVALGFRDYASQLLVKVILDVKRARERGEHVVLMGHSLGGAAACVLAGDVLQAGYEVRGVFTMGSPRPGDAAFAALLEQRVQLGGGWIMRMVNQNDIVTSLPPSRFGFKHVGRPYHFTSSNASNRTGDHRTPDQYGTGWASFLDRGWSYWLGLWRGRPLREAMARHSVMEYCVMCRAAFGSLD